jgi:hypothetical protein
MCVSIIIITPPLHVAFNTLLMEICYYVQLDRLVKEFIVPLENQISSEQEEKQVVENEEIVGQKRARLVVHQRNNWLLPVGQREASGSRFLPIFTFQLQKRNH